MFCNKCETIHGSALPYCPWCGATDRQPLDQTQPDVLQRVGLGDMTFVQWATKTLQESV